MDEMISEHLRSRIEARRLELGFTPTTLADATGLSLQALKNIRKGKVRAYQERLTIPLTDALRWSTDSIDRLLQGLEPVPTMGGLTATMTAGTPSEDAASRLAAVERLGQAQALVVQQVARVAIERLGADDELAARLDALERLLVQRPSREGSP